MTKPRTPKDAAKEADVIKSSSSTSDQAEEAVRSLLRSLNLDEQEDPELLETPRRVAALFHDWLRPRKLTVLRPIPMSPGTSQVVVMRDIPFHAFCAHHLVPFFGDASIAYAPTGDILGFGALPRLVDEASRGPNLQERMAERISRHIDQAVAPSGVVVQLNARQMCVELTGHRCSPRTTTIAALGSYGEAPGRHAAELFAGGAGPSVGGAQRD